MTDRIHDISRGIWQCLILGLKQQTEETQMADTLVALHIQYVFRDQEEKRTEVVKHFPATGLPWKKKKKQSPTPGFILSISQLDRSALLELAEVATN